MKDIQQLLEDDYNQTHLHYSEYFPMMLLALHLRFKNDLELLAELTGNLYVAMPRAIYEAGGM